MTLLLAILPVSVATAEQIEGQNFTGTRNITYAYGGTVPSRNLLDVYMPRSPKSRPAPVVVWIHGGAWYQGSKDSSIRDKAEVFTGAGYVFVSINYRLSPRITDLNSLSPYRVKYPDHPQDAAAAFGWIERNIARYGGDHERLVIAGHSAGAQMATLLATDPSFFNEEGVNPAWVRGVISLDAVGFDIAAITDPASPYVTEEFKPSYWNAFGTPTENAVSGSWVAASPFTHADPEDPPFLMVISRRVALRMSEGRRMARQMGQRIDLATHPVRLNHPEINLRFGTDLDDGGETARAVEFADGVTSGKKPVVRVSIPSRRLRMKAGTSVRKVVIRSASRPVGSPLRCRVGTLPARDCTGRSIFWLRPGRHRFKAHAYDVSGRPGPMKVFTFRVVRGK